MIATVFLYALAFIIRNDFGLQKSYPRAPDSILHIIITSASLHIFHGSVYNITFQKCILRIIDRSSSINGHKITINTFLLNFFTLRT